MKLFTKSLVVGAVVATAAAMNACSVATQESEDTSSASSEGIAVSNGLAVINGLTTSNGLSAANGLANSNGLSVLNGLGTMNGLSVTNGLMVSNGGRDTVSYLVKCALASNQTLVKNVGGVDYTFVGSMGLATGWLNGGIDQATQERVSGCMLAMVNSSGAHVPIYVDVQGVGSIDTNASYSVQEGGFYGNIFTSPPKAYSCRGASQAALVSSRMCGSDPSNCVYKSTGICTSPGNRAQGVGSGGSNAAFAGFINAQALSVTNMDGSGSSQYINDNHQYQTVTVWDQGHN